MTTIPENTLVILKDVVTAAIGGGVVTAIISAFSERRQKRANVDKTLSDTAMTQVDRLLIRTDALTKRMTSLEDENAEKDKKINEQSAQILELTIKYSALQNVLAEKETLIADLRTLSDSQEDRIVELQAEVTRLVGLNPRTRPRSDVKK